ncbi:hypothetical protein [Pedobacter sp.]|uniref:hypothetical protein n=1 Tax=Pedobacter sp. TaxID=1411316 RepID=UPI003C3F2987
MDYHQPIIIEGKEYQFGHLNPFDHFFYSETAKKQLCIEVKFSNHCFTEKCEDPTGHALILKDPGNRDRVFCPIRYAISIDLPDIVREMLESNKPVWQTVHERNWVHTITIQTPVGPYHVFFEVRKASKGEDANVKLFVESAYPEDPEKGPPEVQGKMRIETLCTNTFLRKPIATRR